MWLRASSASEVRLFCQFSWGEVTQELFFFFLNKKSLWAVKLQPLTTSVWPQRGYLQWPQSCGREDQRAIISQGGQATILSGKVSSLPPSASHRLKAAKWQWGWGGSMLEDFSCLGPYLAPCLQELSLCSSSLLGLAQGKQPLLQKILKCLTNWSFVYPMVSVGNSRLDKEVTQSRPAALGSACVRLPLSLKAEDWINCL